jgi:hypothetical protein
MSNPGFDTLTSPILHRERADQSMAWMCDLICGQFAHRSRERGKALLEIQLYMTPRCIMLS